MITPPLFLIGARKIKNLIRKALKLKPVFPGPSWQIVQAGPLKGKKLFLYENGAWQKEMISGDYDSFFFNYLNRLDLRGKTVLDVGAHIGYHALAFAELTGERGKVYAFEPNIFNLERLKMILAENPELAERINTFDFALADKNGEQEFVFSYKIEQGASSGGFLEAAHTARAKEVYEKKMGFKRLPVKTKTLDSLYASGELTDAPALIKIDVEGAETLVLNGARAAISRHKPVLLMEIHSIYNMLTVIEITTELNYGLELLKEEADGRCFIVARPRA